MRKFLLGLFAIALSMTLVACGNNENADVEELDDEENVAPADEEASLVFEDGKVTLEDGTEVALGVHEEGGNIVMNEVADLPNGEKVLSVITYVYDGESLTDITVEMTAESKARAEEISKDKLIMGEGIDEASIEVKGTKIYAKMNESTINQMKEVPKSMMQQLFTK